MTIKKTRTRAKQKEKENGSGITHVYVSWCFAKKKLCLQIDL